MQLTVKHIEGYAYGAIQTTAVIYVSNVEADTSSYVSQLAKLKEALPTFEDPMRFSGDPSLFDQSTAPALFVTIIDILNNYCGDQRFTPINVFKEDSSICFAMPTLAPLMVNAHLNAIDGFMKKLAKGMKAKELYNAIDSLKKQMRILLPAGTNAGNFIAAAAKRRIPFKIFNTQLVIFGYGSGSSIFNSSLTDQESMIGVQLAGSKVTTNRFLKMSGIPVAEQARVRTLEEALNFADKVGYPVVLKPEAEAQGRGVYSNIINESELRECWELLQKNAYKAICIEMHVPGDTYRINTIDDQVVRIVKRIPALVIGNGRSTIAELLDELNNEPLRKDPKNSSMVPLIIDDDVIRTLAKQSFDVNSVPQEGDTVYLTSISNISRGGHVIDFYQEFHPDNFSLCEKISRIMRLNMTGIDVITVDGSQPWRNGDFVVCEVNSMPQLGVSHMHIYDDLVAKKVRIKPYIKLVVSSASASETSLFDPICDSIEITASSGAILRHGCPVQYFDELEISDDVSGEDRLKIERMIVSVQPELVPAIS